MDELIDLDLGKQLVTLNNDLPAHRCYHCNKALSMYYVESLKVPKDQSLVKFFEQRKIDRYCCKMMLLQNYLAMARSK